MTIFNGNKHIALTLFLILVTAGIYIAVCLFILIKRRVTRGKSFIWSTSFTPIGSGFSKSLKKNFMDKIAASSGIKYNPNPLTKEYIENWERHCRKESYTFLYRIRCLNHFLYLQEKLMETGVCAPPKHDIELFLKDAVEAGVLNLSIDSELFVTYLGLYKHARYGEQRFCSEHFEEFVRLQDEMMKKVVQPKLKEPHSKTKNWFCRIADSSHNYIKSKEIKPLLAYDVVEPFGEQRVGANIDAGHTNVGRDSDDSHNSLQGFVSNEAYDVPLYGIAGHELLDMQDVSGTSCLFPKCTLSTGRQMDTNLDTYKRKSRSKTTTIGVDNRAVKC